MVISTLRILPSAKRRRETLEILWPVQGPTLTHPACVARHIYEEARPNQARLFSEKWASAAAFREHLRSDLQQHVPAALDLSRQPPEARIHHVSTSEGMELIEELRGRCGVAPSSNPANAAAQQ